MKLTNEKKWFDEKRGESNNRRETKLGSMVRKHRKNRIKIDQFNSCLEGGGTIHESMEKQNGGEKL